jgi:hypothetical protein
LENSPIYARGIPDIKKTHMVFFSWVIIVIGKKRKRRRR